jgi:hypothetical protein
MTASAFSISHGIKRKFGGRVEGSLDEKLSREEVGEEERELLVADEDVDTRRS